MLSCRSGCSAGEAWIQRPAELPRQVRLGGDGQWDRFLHSCLGICKSDYVVLNFHVIRAVYSYKKIIPLFV